MVLETRPLEKDFTVSKQAMAVVYAEAAEKQERSATGVSLVNYVSIELEEIFSLTYLCNKMHSLEDYTPRKDMWLGIMA